VHFDSHVKEFRTWEEDTKWTFSIPSFLSGCSVLRDSEGEIDSTVPKYTKGCREEGMIGFDIAQAPPMVLDDGSYAIINELSPWLACLLTLCLAWLPALSSMQDRRLSEVVS
jgi:hypothetical protein